MSHYSSGRADHSPENAKQDRQAAAKDSTLMPPPRSPAVKGIISTGKPLPLHPTRQKSSHGVSLTDTPTPSAPSSPQM